MSHLTSELRKKQYNTFITSRSYVQRKHQFHKDQLFDYVMCDTTGLQDAANMMNIQTLTATDARWPGLNHL